MKLTHALVGLITVMLIVSGVPMAEAAAGQTVLVSVNGLVCDFCAQALKKTFGTRQEVASADVNLSSKILTLELKDGAELDEGTIRDLVKKAGYSVVTITR